MKQVVVAMLLLVPACGGDATTDSTSAPEVAETTSAPTTTVSSSRLLGCSGTSADRAADSPSPAATQDPTELEGALLFSRAGGSFGDETIFLSNADGSEEVALTEGGDDSNARVSPDGAKVGYASWPNGRVTITVHEIADGSTTLLTLPGSLNLGMGPWTPDGTRIVAEGWSETEPTLNGLYLVDPAGIDQVERLTRATEGPHIPADVSPDGTLVVFLEEGETHGEGTLFVIPIDGSAEPCLLLPEGTVVGNGGIRFSPDGSRILFPDGRVGGDGALHTVAPDGSGLTTVYDGELFASHADWSPDGSQIIVALNSQGDWFAHSANAIYMLEADVGDPALIWESADHKRVADWFTPAR